MLKTILAIVGLVCGLLLSASSAILMINEYQTKTKDDYRGL